MERLTKRNEHDTSYYIPECFEICAGLGCSEDCNDCHVEHSLIEKLGQYEDAEEQGLLLRLPCKVGDTVYCVNGIRGFIDECKVKRIKCYLTTMNISIEIEMVGKLFHCVRTEMFGIGVFLTKEEAEQKLAEMKGE